MAIGINKLQGILGQVFVRKSVIFWEYRAYPEQVIEPLMVAMSDCVTWPIRDTVPRCEGLDSSRLGERS